MPTRGRGMLAFNRHSINCSASSRRIRVPTTPSEERAAYAAAGKAAASTARARAPAVHRSGGSDAHQNERAIAIVGAVYSAAHSHPAAACSERSGGRPQRASNDSPILRYASSADSSPSMAKKAQAARPTPAACAAADDADASSWTSAFLMSRRCTGRSWATASHAGSSLSMAPRLLRPS
eukprot:6578081-Prymnesium_polylepis.2